MAIRLNELFDEGADEHGWQIVAREMIPEQVLLFVAVRVPDSCVRMVRAVEGRTSWTRGQQFAWAARRQTLRSKSSFAASVGYLSEQWLRRSIEHRWDEAA
jgi:putative transposase